MLDEAGDRFDAFAGAQIGEYIRLVAAHAPGVALHHVEAGADVRREIDLVDHQQVRARDAGAALARDLLALRDVDDVDGDVGKLGRERRRQIVAAGLDEDQIEARKALASWCRPRRG